jgi:hypothetical protein
MSELSAIVGLNRSQEVVGSIPISSTTSRNRCRTGQTRRTLRSRRDLRAASGVCLAIYLPSWASVSRLRFVAGFILISSSAFADWKVTGRLDGSISAVAAQSSFVYVGVGARPHILRRRRLATRCRTFSSVVHDDGARHGLRGFIRSKSSPTNKHMRVCSKVRPWLIRRAGSRSSK